MLKEINNVILELQTKGLTQSQCRSPLNILIQSVEEEKDNEDSPFFGCQLGTDKISAHSNLVKNAVFEAAVLKIQQDKAVELPDIEKEVAKCLLLPVTETPNRSESNQRLSIAEKLGNSKRRKVMPKGKYMDCSFIIGSAVEAERLFLTGDGRPVSPITFEAILFLQQNEDPWDLSTSAQAMSEARSERVQRRIDQDGEQIELHCCN